MSVGELVFGILSCWSLMLCGYCLNGRYRGLEFPE